MTEVKTFKINKTFAGVEKLYEYIQQNIHIIEESTGLEIQNDLELRAFCITAKEKTTERQIIIFASERGFPESLGELIVFAGAYNTDIVIFLLQNISKNYLMPINWLQNISEKDYEFFAGEVKF